uniref:Putative secreted protein n=1 Tax=Ixodes ricinus TaxID=34613 RepID=A0A6B0TY76_IXORI
MLWKLAPVPALQHGTNDWHILFFRLLALLASLPATDVTALKSAGIMLVFASFSFADFTITVMNFVILNSIQERVKARESENMVS